MLDDTMAYSCAHLPAPDATLARRPPSPSSTRCAASSTSTRSDHLVEIGTGWGGLAIHAAEQLRLPRHHHHDLARAARLRAGRRSRLAGSPIASRCCSRTIATSTGQLRQARVHRDDRGGRRAVPGHLLRQVRVAAQARRRHAAAGHHASRTSSTTRALKSVDYIQRFIFPGSFIPSVTAICRVADPGHRLEAVPPRGHRPALRAARSGPVARALLREPRQGARAGIPESFVRLWEFYLCYCEGGFTERQLGDVQMLLTKPDCRARRDRGGLISAALSVRAAHDAASYRTGNCWRACSVTTAMPDGRRRALAPLLRDHRAALSAAARWRVVAAATASQSSRACWRSATHAASASFRRAATPATAAAPRPMLEQPALLLSLAPHASASAPSTRPNFTLMAEAGCVARRRPGRRRRRRALFSAEPGLRRHLPDRRQPVDQRRRHWTSALRHDARTGARPRSRCWRTAASCRHAPAAAQGQHRLRPQALFIGAEGTLGIITAACLKLYPGGALAAPRRSIAVRHAGGCRGAARRAARAQRRSASVRSN